MLPTLHSVHFPQGTLASIPWTWMFPLFSQQNMLSDMYPHDFNATIDTPKICFSTPPLHKFLTHISNCMPGHLHLKTHRQLQFQHIQSELKKAPVIKSTIAYLKSLDQCFWFWVFQNLEKIIRSIQATPVRVCATTLWSNMVFLFSKMYHYSLSVEIAKAEKILMSVEYLSTSSSKNWFY